MKTFKSIKGNIISDCAILDRRGLAVYMEYKTIMCMACANYSLNSADIGIKVPRHSYKIRADTSCINIQLFIETNILGFKSRTATLEYLRCGVSSIFMPHCLQFSKTIAKFINEMQDEMQYKTFPSALYPIYTDC